MKCPHCQKEVNECFYEDYLGEYENGFHYSVFSMKCPNEKCNKIIIELGKSRNIDFDEEHHEILDENGLKVERIFPIGGDRPKAPKEVESIFAEDYNEACLVLPFSPKASAALSRRCLQNIIRMKEGIKGRNLKTEIDELIATKKLPSYISENLDIIRGFGNIAAHGMKDQKSGLILDVEPNEAEFLLDVLDLLFDFYFVLPTKSKNIKTVLGKKLSSTEKNNIQKE